MHTYSICFQLFPFKRRLIANKTASFKVLQLRFACPVTVAAVGSGAPRHIPVPAASQSRRTLPAGSPQAGSVFGCQGVGDDFLIAHQFRNPGAPAVKEAAPVGNTIGAKPGHFRCFPIIQSAGNGAPNNRNSMNGVQIIYDSHTEFAAAHLSTVPVMRQNKRIGVPQGDR